MLFMYFNYFIIDHFISKSRLLCLYCVCCTLVAYSTFSAKPDQETEKGGGE